MLPGSLTRVLMICSILSVLSCGSQGDRGPIGANGENGAVGKDGPEGANGQAGANGQPGRDGTDGTDGAAGTDGTDGSDGTDGTDGTDGLSGNAVTTTARTYVLNGNNDVLGSVIYSTDTQKGIYSDAVTGMVVLDFSLQTPTYFSPFGSTILFSDNSCTTPVGIEDTSYDIAKFSVDVIDVFPSAALGDFALRITAGTTVETVNYDSTYITYCSDSPPLATTARRVSRVNAEFLLNALAGPYHTEVFSVPIK